MMLMGGTTLCSDVACTPVTANPYPSDYRNTFGSFVYASNLAYELLLLD